MDFAGPSYFGGKNSELVLCAGKGISRTPIPCSHLAQIRAAGEIHIWDQESGTLLHHVRAQASGGDLTCIAWNHASEDPFMFATGSHDGAVRIWTKRLDEADEELLDPPLTGAHIPWANSPFEMLEHERSESPLAQQDFDYLHESLSDDAGPLLRDRAGTSAPAAKA